MRTNRFRASPQIPNRPKFHSITALLRLRMQLGLVFCLNSIWKLVVRDHHRLTLQCSLLLMIPDDSSLHRSLEFEHSTLRTYRPVLLASSSGLAVSQQARESRVRISFPDFQNGKIHFSSSRHSEVLLLFSGFGVNNTGEESSHKSAFEHSVECVVHL